jgi:mono/diheme cytochrome c family protein
VKRASPVLFAAFLFLLLAIAIPPAVNSQKSVPKAAAKGRRIFAQSCAACHDTLGTTTKSGPGLKSYYQREPRPVDATVRIIIERGKGGMPGFSSLDMGDLDELVAYLKTL